MQFQDVFKQETTQLDRYSFTLGEADALLVTLQGPFAHCPVMIHDAKQQLRALLSFKTRKPTYCIAKDAQFSSNLTVAGELPAGEWTITVMCVCHVVGDYTITVEPSKLPTSIEDRKEIAGVLGCAKEQLIASDKRWYHGDLHLHSYYSDGRVSHLEIDEEVKRKQLDFIALTDHSLITTKFVRHNYLLVPGTEITWDNEGHYNIYGIDELLDYASYFQGCESKSVALDRLFKDVKKRWGDNACISINHPFPLDWQMNHHFDIDSVDCIEVINSPYLKPREVDNQTAVQFFDFLWQKDILLPAIGGSDAHKKNYCETYPVGLPTNHIFCAGLSTTNLLQSMRAGHTYLSVGYNVTIDFRDSSNNTILPGSRTTGEVMLNASCEKEVTWQLVQNGVVIETVVSSEYRGRAKIKRNDYVRLEARDVAGDIVFFANPLHDKVRRYQHADYLDLLNEFKSEQASND